ncbi:MAG: type II restriction enzyme [Bacteroidota bacterium]
MATANDRCWAEIFSHYDIINQVMAHGYYDITADAIKEYREPRLMCKIDYRQNLPEVFAQNNFSVLAIKNGLYRIAPTHPFINIKNYEYFPNIYSYPVVLPTYIQTIQHHNITSESQVIDASFLSGMINSVVQENVSLTIRGRRSSGVFNFNLKGLNNQSYLYNVEGVQIEVDSGYEGERGIYLFEVKMGIPSNINLRQLIYPHISFSQHFSKEVKSFLLCYDPGKCFVFYPFIYDLNTHVAGINHSHIKIFNLVDGDRPELRLSQISLNPDLIDYNVPFPQANSFSRVYTIFLKIAEMICVEKSDLFLEFDIVPRQYDYYLNTLLWMKLAVKDGDCYRLSDIGQSLIPLSERERLFNMAVIIFSNEIFHNFLHENSPTISQEIRRRCRLETDSTFRRRVQTVKSWCRFFRERFLF